MKPRISMITLGVDDLQRAIKFYQHGLGFPRHGEGEDENVAFFNLQGTWLGLYGREALAEDAQVAFETSSFNSCSMSHNLASEADVDEVYQQAIDAGAQVVKAPQKVFWGGYSGYFKDPDGHLWEIAHNPFAWIGPKDTDS
ncbi:VOC family protein [Reinekea marina]|uniref:VOC family protein n=1 Tax=Reinekea marina TaxID=1310421 RepID=A0ABV7WUT2_9GAMM|nr:VOC family protein [Reinekea marina]MBU2864316.1 VOC family protein [Reinekea forsetii]MDN3647464.1 VOC family protein [Reinekea marina]